MMTTTTKLNKIDRRNLTAGLNAVVWPYLLVSPLGFLTGIIASACCVLVVGTILFFRDRNRYAGCELRSYLLLFLPGLVYWSLAILFNRLFA